MVPHLPPAARGCPDVWPGSAQDSPPDLVALPRHVSAQGGEQAREAVAARSGPAPSPSPSITAHSPPGPTAAVGPGGTAGAPPDGCGRAGSADRCRRGPQAFRRTPYPVRTGSGAAQGLFFGGGSEAGPTPASWPLCPAVMHSPMPSGPRSLHCRPPTRAKARSGPITTRSSTRSSSAPAPGPPGTTSPNATGPGKPPQDSTAAGPSTPPGKGTLTGYASTRPAEKNPSRASTPPDAVGVHTANLQVYLTSSRGLQLTNHTRGEELGKDRLTTGSSSRATRREQHPLVAAGYGRGSAGCGGAALCIRGTPAGRLAQCLPGNQRREDGERRGLLQAVPEI
jgi:hypothetical protein